MRFPRRKNLEKPQRDEYRLSQITQVMAERAQVAVAMVDEDHLYHSAMPICCKYLVL